MSLTPAGIVSSQDRSKKNRERTICREHIQTCGNVGDVGGGGVVVVVAMAMAGIHFFVSFYFWWTIVVLVAYWPAFIFYSMFIATFHRSFSVLHHQFTKNRSAASLNVLHLIIAGSDTEQRASKSGVYTSGPGANGQKTPVACGPCRMSRPVVVLPKQILNNNNKKRKKKKEGKRGSGRGFARICNEQQSARSLWKLCAYR